MTINDLQMLAGYLYRKSEENSPIVGNTERKAWMARRIESAIDNNDPALQELLMRDSDEEVIDLLEEWYRGVPNDAYTYPNDAYQ